MRRQRNAKIVATLGPASSDERTIRALFEAGADVFRLNFSHGTHEDHTRTFEAVRAAAVAVDRPLGILGDLQGPKFRVGTFKAKKVRLERGAAFSDGDDIELIPAANRVMHEMAARSKPEPDDWGIEG